MKESVPRRKGNCLLCGFFLLKIAGTRGNSAGNLYVSP